MSRKGVRDSNKPSIGSSESPAISAVLLECPKDHRRSSKPDCERQMMVHIRVSPTFQIDSLDKFLLLDEVYDQRRQTRAKLMSPYVIEISRGEPVIMYPLQFAKSIRCETCGHKTGNSTSQETCDQESPALPEPKPAEPNVAALHGGGLGSSLAAHPYVPLPFAGVHPPRSTDQQQNEKQEQQQQQQQQQQHQEQHAQQHEEQQFQENHREQHLQQNQDQNQNQGQHQDHQQHQQQEQQQQQDEAKHADNEATSMGKDSKTSEKPGPETKLSIGIINPPSRVHSKNPSNVEECFPSSDMLFHDVDDNGAIYGMEYDSDEYDERNQNDDRLIGSPLEAGYLGQNTYRNKRLKSRPLAPSFSPSSSKLDDALSESEKLFHDAENQSEEARMETIDAFRMKHAHPAGTIIGSSSPGAGVNVASYLSAAGGSDGKPHVAGIREDSIRPQEDFDADGADSDVDVDVGGKFRGGQQRNYKQQQQHARLLTGHQYQIDDPEFVKINNRPHLVAVHREPNKWPDVQFPTTSLHGSKGSSRNQENFASNLNSENAFRYSTKKLHPSLRHWQQQQERQDPEDSSDEAGKKKFSFNEDFDTQGTSSGTNSDGGVEDEDYDREDSLGRDSGSVIQTRSNNIAKIDDTGIAAGGMGDEFYWNTLNYPKTQDLYSKPAAVKDTSSAIFDYRIGSGTTGSDKLHDTSSFGHNTPKRLTSASLEDNDDDESSVFARNSKGSGSSVRGKAKKGKLRTPFHGHSATPPWRDFYNQQTEFDSPGQRPATKRRRDDSNPSAKTNKNEGCGKKTCSDSMALTRMKVRSSGDVDVDVENSREVLEPPVIPSFPLNNYPGYLGVKSYSEYIPPAPAPSHYRLLEHVPQELIPHQPQFAKELGDPNLTVNDKINLLEVLTAHDDVNDEILRRLQHELDNSLIIHDLSAHDRMPLPAKKKKKKSQLRKRSYVVYDDLTMRDTYDQYDDLDSAHPVDIPYSRDRTAVNPDDVASCKSCEGKKCQSKSEGKTCVCDRDGIHCKCVPKTVKKIRSVADAWYSVFNMSAPLQFLTTRVGIFRKRQGAWWRIAPSITLTSLSGIYANGNLSILFSSHVDIFQLKRPLSLENHKLLIPHDGDTEEDAVNLNSFETIDPSDILAIDSTKFDFNAIHDDTVVNDDSDDDQNESTAKRNLCQAAIRATDHTRKRRSHSSSDAVLSIGDLGYFPGDMNILQKCPGDEKHLCLNMLDEQVPAFTVKIKQPFLENALIFKGEYKVRIASVISDATTKGALQVAVVLVNENYVNHEFAVRISNCPMTCGAKTTVKKELAPHMSETVTFLLPLEENKAKKLSCTVEPTARCLCIWECDCHCVPSLVSHDDYNVCHKLDDYEENAAGFKDGKTPELDQELTGWRWFWWRMNHYAFSLLLCMLFLGFLKAILGAIGLGSIDRYGYDYVQPLQKYDYASRCRRFFINIVFFVVLPFIFCCKCFTPTEEDLLLASTEWQCSLVQQDVTEDSDDDDEGGGNDGGGGGGGGARIGGGGWKPYERYRNGNDNRGHDMNDDDDDEETILSQRFESGDGSQTAGLGISHSRLSEYLIGACDYDEEEEERDTNYVLQALTESRESIRKLLNSQCTDDVDPNNPHAREAEELVRKLVAAKIVFRTFEMPLRNVEVSAGQKYSIRGYFVPSVGPGYQYFTPSPLVQIRRITANTSAFLMPPVILKSEEFSRVYTSKLEVLEAGDLSVYPPMDAPCINSSNTTHQSQLAATPTTAAFGESPLQPTEPMVGDTGSMANDLDIEPTKPAPVIDVPVSSDRVGDANNEKQFNE